VFAGSATHSFITRLPGPHGSAPELISDATRAAGSLTTKRSRASTIAKILPFTVSAIDANIVLATTELSFANAFAIGTSRGCISDPG
jgi:hypothetical protein